MKSLISLLLTAALALAGASAGANEPRVIEQEGVIHSIDYAASYAMISGAGYRFAVDADIQVGGGSYGAVTMLTPGMKVRVVFKDFGSDGREIITLEELPAGYVIEES